MPTLNLQIWRLCFSRIFFIFWGSVKHFSVESTVNDFYFFCWRVFSILSIMQAAYKVGLHSISAQTIEHSILGFRSNRPAQVGTEKKTSFFLNSKNCSMIWWKYVSSNTSYFEFKSIKLQLYGINNWTFFLLINLLLKSCNVNLATKLRNHY